LGTFRPYYRPIAHNQKEILLQKLSGV